MKNCWSFAGIATLEHKHAAANERMWPAMTKDEALTKLLMETYEKREDRLGFSLVD